MNIIEGTKKRVEFTNEEIETLKKSFCILQEVYDILEEDSYVRIIKKVFDEVFDEESVFIAKEVVSAFASNNIFID